MPHERLLGGLARNASGVLGRRAGDVLLDKMLPFASNLQA